LRALFHSKDRDLDGRISFDEFCDQETVNERAFRAMDINSDGYVSKDEMLRTTTRWVTSSVLSLN
jgi:Ca2+-binding EF-hand superfamily protein